jgi:hypothetical protein
MSDAENKRLLEEERPSTDAGDTLQSSQPMTMEERKAKMEQLRSKMVSREWLLESDCK